LPPPVAVTLIQNVATERRAVGGRTSEQIDGSGTVG
jgi:hypothetical protein